MSNNLSEKLHHAWLIAAACFCIQGAGLGIVHNCRGIFFNELMAELGIQMSQLMGYMAMFGIASVLAMPFVARCLEKWDIRWVMGSCAILISVAQFVQGYFTALWQWYIVGVVQGVCYAVLVPLTVPLLIRNWFVEKRGMVLGIAGAASGIVGAVMNAIGNNVIIQMGWRTAYHMLGVVSFVMLVPFCCFVVRANPESMGLKAYGAGSGPETEQGGFKQGLTLSQVKKTTGFWLLLLVTAIICYSTCFNQMLKDFGLSLGWNASVAGLLTTVAMLGNIGGKVLLGYIHDKRGVHAALLFGMALMVVGYLCDFSGTKFVPLLIGAAIAGIPMGISVVLFPGWTISQFGEKHYSSIFTVVSVVMNLFSSFGYLIYSGLLDFVGGYDSVLWFSLISCAVAVVCVIIEKANRKTIVKGVQP